MKLSKEQQLELQIIDLKLKLNDSIAQNLQLAGRDLANYRDNFLYNIEKEAREKENKPEDKFDCSLDYNTFEVIFKEKGGDNVV